MRRASSSSYCSCARSTRLTTSPIPRMRSAIRAGWNTSSASIFSPVPMNLIGLLTTVRILNAAPPRASPSSFVSTTPSKSNRSLNSFAVFTASCPVMASTTNKVSLGSIVFLIAAISFIICSSTARRPAVSTITTSYPIFRASAIASCAIFTGSPPLSGLAASPLSNPPLAKTFAWICSPNTRSCSIAAGR